VLLFHDDPEKFVTGAFVKIGYFRSDSDLAYHDTLHGDLFSQAARTIELLRFKYLKAAITYQGIQRIERYPVPDAALREAVLNALVHRDYAVGAPVQIRVYDDRLTLWNPGVLPEGWTLKTLLGAHASTPFNPAIANVFFRSGEIETWGRGIQRIFAACKEAGTPRPKLTFDGTSHGTSDGTTHRTSHRTSRAAGATYRIGVAYGDRLDASAGPGPSPHLPLHVLAARPQSRPHRAHPSRQTQQPSPEIPPDRQGAGVVGEPSENMSDLGKSERATQDRVIALFVDELGYRYLGDWSDRNGNSNIDEPILSAWLAKAGHTPDQISRAIYLLKANGPRDARALREQPRGLLPAASRRAGENRGR